MVVFVFGQMHRDQPAQCTDMPPSLKQMFHELVFELLYLYLNSHLICICISNRLKKCTVMPPRLRQRFHEGAAVKMSHWRKKSKIKVINFPSNCTTPCRQKKLEMPKRAIPKHWTLKLAPFSVTL